MGSSSDEQVSEAGMCPAFVHGARLRQCTFPRGSPAGATDDARDAVSQERQAAEVLPSA